MCCNEKDEELWNTDPHEYIRSKFGIFKNILLFSLYNNLLFAFMKIQLIKKLKLAISFMY